MPSRPITPDHQKTNPNIRSKFILLAITISAFAIFLMTIIYILYHLWDNLFHRSRTNPFDTATPTLKLQKFSYKELKSATNQFNPDNSIGKGGFGTVFRGILRDGKSVAIKKLDAAASLQAEREFQSELTILGSIRSPHVVSLLGYCIEKNKRVLVYEYMPNRSLQDLLFNNNNDGRVNSGCMNWERRFQVIQDVVRAVEVLHNECDPPVIHGDIKPSNVLLDWDFKAKISDFGLSRVKVEDEVGIDLFSQDLGKSQDLWKSQDLSGNLNGETTPPVGTPPVDGHCSSGEVDFALALQASTSSKSGKGLHNLNNGNPVSNNCSSKTSPKGKEVLVEDIVSSFDQELSSVEHSKELAMDDVGEEKQWGKDWWWKQEDSGELCSKDYVNEWIGTQICASTTNRDWENMSLPMESNLGYSPQLDKLKEENEEFNCPDEKGFEAKDISVRKKKPRKMQDWWKEEKNDELSKSKRTCLKNKMRRSIRVPHFGLGRQFCFLKRSSSRELNQEDDYNPKHEFSFKKGWKKKNSRSMGSEMSGELFSRDLSSTTSMRGTLCYVAPEYGGCGYLMEKGDIYSLGVLILVIISGRRPLHVLNSPMKFEKANLISWSRHLAQAGNILELVDEKLKDAYNKEQVTLCINLALSCLQRLPELRPDIGDIVKILSGEMDLLPLTFEFSPSPPSRFYSRSRRKHSE